MKKSKDETIRELRQTIRHLSAKLAADSIIHAQVCADQARLRAHFLCRFDWWFQLIAEGKTPDLLGLIRNDALWLRTLERWDMGTGPVKNPL